MGSGNEAEGLTSAEIEALEDRVRIKELLAREIEAELRLVKAQAEQRRMNARRKRQLKSERKARRKARTESSPAIPEPD